MIKQIKVFALNNNVKHYTKVKNHYYAFKVVKTIARITALADDDTPTIEYSFESESGMIAHDIYCKNTEGKFERLTFDWEDINCIYGVCYAYASNKKFGGHGFIYHDGMKFALQSYPTDGSSDMVVTTADELAFSSNGITYHDGIYSNDVAKVLTEYTETSADGTELVKKRIADDMMLTDKQISAAKSVMAYIKEIEEKHGIKFYYESDNDTIVAARSNLKCSFDTEGVDVPIFAEPFICNIGRIGFLGCDDTLCLPNE